MLREVRLHGQLGIFGRAHELDVSSVSEAVRALCIKCKGFRQVLAQGDYHVIWRNKHTYVLAADGLNMQLGQEGSIHIVPAIKGAKSGWWQVIAGAVLIATAFFLAPAGAGFLGAAWGAEAISLGTLGAITYGNIATIGLGLMLLGAGSLLAPKPPTLGTDNGSSPPDGGSLFSNPQNVSVQGMAVPLVYGRFLVGSIIISSGLSNAAVPPGSNVGLTSSVAGAGICNCPITPPQEMTQLDVENEPVNSITGQSGLMHNGYLYVPGDYGGVGSVPLARLNTTSLVTEWLQLDPGVSPDATNIVGNPATDGTYVYVVMSHIGTPIDEGVVVARIHSDFSTVDYLPIAGSYAWGGSYNTHVVAGNYLYILHWDFVGSDVLNYVSRVNLSDFTTVEEVALTTDLSLQDTGQSWTIVSDGTKAYIGSLRHTGTNTTYFVEMDPLLAHTSANMILHNMTGITDNTSVSELRTVVGDWLYWSCIDASGQRVVRTRLNDFSDSEVLASGFYAQSIYYDGTRYLWGNTDSELWRLDTVNSYNKEEVDLNDAQTNPLNHYKLVPHSGIWKDGLKMFLVVRELGPDEVPQESSPVFTFNSCS